MKKWNMNGTKNPNRVESIYSLSIVAADVHKCLERRKHNEWLEMSPQVVFHENVVTVVRFALLILRRNSNLMLGSNKSWACPLNGWLGTM